MSESGVFNLIDERVDDDRLAQWGRAGEWSSGSSGHDLKLNGSYMRGRNTVTMDGEWRVRASLDSSVKDTRG